MPCVEKSIFIIKNGRMLLRILKRLSITSLTTMDMALTLIMLIYLNFIMEIRVQR